MVSFIQMEHTGHGKTESVGRCMTNERRLGQVEIKRRDHITLRGEVTAITLHLEQKQEKARLARERVDSVEVGTFYEEGDKRS